MATMMIGELYDALKSAGADDANARAASQAVAGFDNRVDGLERKIDRLEGKVDRIEGKFDTKLDGLEKRMSFQFAIVLAIQGVTLVAVLRNVILNG